MKLDVPLALIAGGEAANAGAPGVALPTLAYRARSFPRLEIEAGGERYPTARIVDVDSVVTREFDNEYNLVLAKTFYVAAAKAAAAFAANATAANQNAVAGLLARLGTSAYQIGTNQADRRTWQTLPKEVQVAHFPTPDDRVVRVVAAPGRGATVALEPGLFNVLFVKSPSRAAPLSIRQVAIPADADAGDDVALADGPAAAR